MKRSFDFVLKGGDWWGPFLGFWVLFWTLYIPILLLPRWISPTESPVLYFLVLLILLISLDVLMPIFTIIFLRDIIPKLSIGGKAFGFRGSIGRYIGINLVGVLLSIVTFMIYLPWYLRRITAYIVSEASFDGTNPEFLGRGGRLFKYMLLTLWVPVIVVSILLGFFVGLATAKGGGWGVRELIIIVTLVIFFLLIPFTYLTYKWYVDIGWKDVKIRWKTSFWPSCFYILGQVLLTVITAGIYGPAAMLRLYRYFTGRTVLQRGENEIGRLGFEGSIGRGFGLIWGQSLLALITAGIYVPWAFANVGRWLLGATYFQGSAASP